MLNKGRSCHHFVPLILSHSRVNSIRVRPNRGHSKSTSPPWSALVPIPFPVPIVLVLGWCLGVLFLSLPLLSPFPWSRNTSAFKPTKILCNNENQRLPGILRRWPWVEVGSS